jgi:hypothetical protein
MNKTKNSNMDIALQPNDKKPNQAEGSAVTGKKNEKEKRR